MKRSVFGTTARRFALLGGVLLIVACYYATRELALLNPCANELRGELVSPDTRYIAAYYVRDCGMNKNFSTHVSIRPAERNFDYASDVRLFSAAGICDVDVEWTQRVLHIHYPRSCYVKNQANSWRGIRVYLDET